MDISAVQFDIAWENPPANFAAVQEMFEKSPPKADSLVVLPEMFATGFSMDTKVGIAAYEETKKYLAELARRFGVCICGGLASPGPAGRCFNQAMVFDKTGCQIARATKLHPFTLANEEKFYAPGEEVCVFELAGVKLAVLICYDLRFPESFREAVGSGAEVFVVIANWPAVRRDHWQTLLRARAIENQAAIIGVNRIGSDPKCEYSGDSMIIAPRGEILTEAACRSDIISASLDIADLREYREKFPALRDMR